MRALVIVAIFVLLPSLVSVGAHAADEERIALVIGNAGYQNADDLINPTNDARAIGAALEELGFETELALDLDQRGMQRALREFGFRAESADVALVFYAGHGIQVAGENYLLPVDATLRRERDLIYEALPLAHVLGEVAQARQLGIVILDACRDNPLADRLRQSLGPVRSRLVGTGLSRIDNMPSDTMIAFATRPGDVAVDGEGEHSPYTQALLQHIEEPGLELNLMFRRVRDSVLEETRQRQEPRTYDSLGAEPFYFVPPRPNRRPVIGEIAPMVVLDDAGPTPLALPDASDPDDDPITMQITSLPDSGEIQVAGRPALIGDILTPRQLKLARFEPVEGGATGDVGSLGFLIKDDRGGTTIARLPITVEQANEPPRVAQPHALTLPSIPLNIDPPIDPDGDPLVIEVVEVPDGGVIRDAEREVRVGEVLDPDQLAGLVLDPGMEGTRGAFAFKVTDSRGASVTSRLQINFPGLSTAAPPPQPEVAAVEQEPVEEPEPSIAEPEPEAEAVAAPETPEERSFDIYVTNRGSNIREGPSTGTARVTTVPAQTRLRVFGRAEGRNWFLVETEDGVSGYIFATLVEPAEREEPAPAVSVPAVADDDSGSDEASETQVAQVPIGRTLTGGIRDCESCPALVSVPGGSFIMGSDFGHSSERPTRRVQVDSFALGKFEVTVGQWQACVDAGACQPQAALEGVPAEVPVHDVSWSDAQDYVAWLREVTGEQYRLPSEAEWEYAARGGTSGLYWWGDEAGDGRANCKNCGGPWDEELPAQAGSFDANAFGLHDMNGGAMEWVADCWYRDHSGAPRDGSARNERNCAQRVLRGGSWRNDKTYATSSSRLGYDFDVRYLSNGFRVARDLQ